MVALKKWDVSAPRVRAAIPIARALGCYKRNNSTNKLRLTAIEVGLRKLKIFLDLKNPQTTGIMYLIPVVSNLARIFISGVKKFTTKRGADTPERLL